MTSAHTWHRRKSPQVLSGAMLVLGLAAQQASAADAHRAVQAKPGEIVLLRDVPTRPADRVAPPGMALLVNPSPRHELEAALGVGELSDADYARLDASPASPTQRPSTVETMVGRALGQSTSGTHATRMQGPGAAMAGPAGTMAGATRGIGAQVQGAVSVLPGLSGTAGSGH